MREWLKSARSFGVGMLRRFWWWLAGVVVAAFDVVEWLTGKAIDVPNWTVWTLLGVGLSVSAIDTYHEVRMEAVRASATLVAFRDRRKAIERIANQQSAGNELKKRCRSSADDAYPELLLEIREWNAATRQVLLEEASEHVSEFERDQESGLSYDRVSVRMNALMSKLDGRLKGLSSILDRLDAQSTSSS
jgi:hypothetical protein